MYMGINKVYTSGCYNLKYADFIEILNSYKIKTVVDIRNENKSLICLYNFDSFEVSMFNLGYNYHRLDYNFRNANSYKYLVSNFDIINSAVFIESILDRGNILILSNSRLLNNDNDRKRLIKCLAANHLIKVTNISGKIIDTF